jgi:hypothetical protein
MHCKGLHICLLPELPDQQAPRFGIRKFPSEYQVAFQLRIYCKT